MDVQKYLETLHLLEKLKNTTRHAYTSQGRRESVAEHCWRVAMMALLMADEFPGADMNKVIRMCLIHDLGEIFTGDIPVFQKTDADREKEDTLLQDWIGTLPAPYCGEFAALFSEMDALETTEARLYKALDSTEALLQHNESPLDTWEDHEYDLQRTYAHNRVAFSPYMKAFRQLLLDETEAKIKNDNNIKE